MKKYSFSNTISNDLWNSLSQVNEKVDVTAFMKNWIFNIGHPLITVSEDNGRYTLSQKRMFIYESSGSDINDNQQWIVPISVIYKIKNKNIEKKNYEMKDKTLTIDLPNVEWVKFNHLNKGFYCVQYATKQYNDLINLLKTNNEVQYFLR